MRAEAEIPSRLLVEADLFVSILIGDELQPCFGRVVDEAERGNVELLGSSEIYNDLISAFRSQGIKLERITGFVSDMKAVPHRILPVGPRLAEEALTLYAKHGGPGNLHYFDSFHVATAKLYGLPLLTSDRYVVGNSRAMGISAVDPRELVRKSRR